MPRLPYLYFFRKVCTMKVPRQGERMAHETEHIPGGPADVIPGQTEVHASHSGDIEPLRTVEQAGHNKHHRLMRRTLRWPLHSNTHRVTF